MTRGGPEGDLESINLINLVTEKVDILIGGPPCQGFSRIGRAKIDSLNDRGFREQGYREDPRNDLYMRFLDAVRIWRPRAVVLENVPGMLSLGGRNVADSVSAELETCGYTVGYSVLNAVLYGVLPVESKRANLVLKTRFP